MPRYFLGPNTTSQLVLELKPILGNIALIMGRCMASSCVYVMVVLDSPNVMLGNHIIQYAVAASNLVMGALMTPVANRRLLDKLSWNCVSWFPVGLGQMPSVRWAWEQSL